ncbi:MAG: hypothetical protein ACR2P2_09945 [Nakamurella sp.]
MNIHEARELIGTQVEYRAFTGARTQVAVITDTRPDFVMVQFAGCSYSRSVHPRDLQLPEAGIWTTPEQRAQIST